MSQIPSIQRVPLPADSGALLGIAELNGRVIVACEHGLYQVYDEPARASGQYEAPKVRTLKVW